MKKNIDLISYPFLNEDFGPVDHEVLTDYLSSILGRIYSLDTPLKEETFWLMDKVLHLNGSIRGKLAIFDSDIQYGLNLISKLKSYNKDRISGFVYPIGHPIACEYHVARGIAKRVCRNLYLLKKSGTEVPEILLDFSNLMTNLLFLFSLEVNRLNNIQEKVFISKSY
ncbi:ATP:cob(I)alamin adenosyltransferase [Clostridium thermobutyricum]|uniref:Cobalamin adenosyltransferase n=1 Tax=Clostridium thermobutyricum DSM 4928 TaxID=1121339 RepID=A0A1V4SS95_9CLOT|nr:hypothetical protein [Clostridium thermobutyricum]OPX46068.1 cobalamin adenosyltransferase [Clostridium thermobutyricum DSM 4928]OPX46171.1 cobalamin adenosyltransferase [Clostridium thermobutyricum DSM 4928]